MKLNAKCLTDFRAEDVLHEIQVSFPTSLRSTQCISPQSRSNEKLLEYAQDQHQAMHAPYQAEELPYLLSNTPKIFRQRLPVFYPICS